MASALTSCGTAGGFQSIAFADGANSDAQTAGIGDIAGAFGDLLHANATGANFLFDILPSL